MKVWNERVKREKVLQFDDILESCHGRYLSLPTLNHDEAKYMISYEIESSEIEMFYRLWGQTNIEIVEVRKDQLWRRILRRIFS